MGLLKTAAKIAFNRTSMGKVTGHYTGKVSKVFNPISTLKSKAVKNVVKEAGRGKALTGDGIKGKASSALKGLGGFAFKHRDAIGAGIGAAIQAKRAGDNAYNNAIAQGKSPQEAEAARKMARAGGMVKGAIVGGAVGHFGGKFLDKKTGGKLSGLTKASNKNLGAGISDSKKQAKKNIKEATARLKGITDPKAKAAALKQIQQGSGAEGGTLLKSANDRASNVAKKQTGGFWNRKEAQIERKKMLEDNKGAAAQWQARQFKYDGKDKIDTKKRDELAKRLTERQIARANRPKNADELFKKAKQSEPTLTRDQYYKAQGWKSYTGLLNKLFSKFKNTTLGRAEYLRSLGIDRDPNRFYPWKAKGLTDDEIRLDRNRLSNRINRMHRSPKSKLLTGTKVGLLGTAVGTGIGALSTIGLKKRLKRKYWDKTDEDIQKMYEIQRKQRLAAGAVIGGITGSTGALIYRNNRYNKARRRLSDASDLIFKNQFRQSNN